MQLTSNVLLLIATASTVSTWTFTGYSEYNFLGDVVLSDSGSGLGTGTYSPYATAIHCTNFADYNNDQLSSFEWDRGVDEFCKFSLFRDTYCLGSVLISSRTVSLEHNMSPETNNQASSLSVHCFDTSERLRLS